MCQICQNTHKKSKFVAVGTLFSYRIRFTNRNTKFNTINDMDNNDAEIKEIFESPRMKRQLRRRSSLYGSPLLKSEKTGPENTKLKTVAQLQNEKIQWIRLQEKILADSLRVEPPIKTSMKCLDTELRVFISECPDMNKFIEDTKALAQKFQFYKKMENHFARRLKYAEDRLKDRVNEATAKLFVNEVEEKVYL